MDKLQRLRAVIRSMPCDDWDDKVIVCANLVKRSRSTVYQWLSDQPPIPDLTLIALETLNITTKQEILK